MPRISSKHQVTLPLDTLQRARAARALDAILSGGDAVLLSLINYAETLVRPAEHERTLRTALTAGF